MKRPSCINFKDDGCKLELECSNLCSDYSHKALYRLTPEDAEILGDYAKKQLAKQKKDEKAYKKAISGKPDPTYRYRKTTKKSKYECKLICPNDDCKNRVIEDIIRLRDGFFQCRKCGETFAKSDAVDSFDFDGIEENL